MTRKFLRIDILTLFPNFFSSPLSASLIEKAITKKILRIGIHDIRESGTGTHKQVDDRPFGGGPGMVLKPDVLATALKKATKKEAKTIDHGGTPHVILLDPAGKSFNQEAARRLSEKSWLVLICGHYEGVDERFKQLCVSEEISIGDYILSGGEPAALVVLDAVARLVPGFLAKEESTIFESFSKTTLGNRKVLLLDYPVFTRPENFAGRLVPKVLLSGNHGEIKRWRAQAAIKKTKKRRPDLLATKENSKY